MEDVGYRSRFTLLLTEAVPSNGNMACSGVFITMMTIPGHIAISTCYGLKNAGLGISMGQFIVP